MFILVFYAKQSFCSSYYLMPSKASQDEDWGSIMDLTLVPRCKAAKVLVINPLLLMTNLNRIQFEGFFILGLCWFCKGFSTLSFHCHRWFLDLLLGSFLCCRTQANGSYHSYSVKDRQKPWSFPRSSMFKQERIWVCGWWKYKIWSYFHI